MIGFAIHSDYPPVNLAPVNMAKSTILDDFPSYKTFRDFPASHVDDDIYICIYIYYRRKFRSQTSDNMDR